MGEKVRSTIHLGRFGEQCAAEYLQRQGMLVHQRNWRCRWGELDIIAQDGETLVVVEVKTRRGTTFANVGEAVDRRKLARIRTLASLWLAEQARYWPQLRFDVVAVHVDSRTLELTDAKVTIKHFPGVF